MIPDPRADPNLTLETIRRVDDVCTIFERKWRGGERPRLEDLLAGSVCLDYSALLRELLAIEIELRLRAGEQPVAAEYVKRFPIQHNIVDLVFQEADLAAGHGAASHAAHKSDAISAASPGSELPRVFGDYQLLAEIARGGMGVIYKARQLSLDRLVAVKMILSGQLASAIEVERFYLEAQAAAQLKHPQIVPIIEVGQSEGQRYYSMAFVDGVSLASRLAAGSLAPRDAAELLLVVAEAVHYAHEHGLIHRDLKPSNILLDADGSPHVTDFGLAKRVSANSDLTTTGQIIGTPSFMPPEQATGKMELISPASDVYSLGAVLYALLTGRPPFQAATPIATLKQVLEREPAPPRLLDPMVPRDLQTIALKCLEKNPTKRYESARALADELRRFLSGVPILARPAGGAERLWRWTRRQPIVAALLAIVLASLTGGTTVSTYFAIRAQEQASAAESSAAAASCNAIEEHQQRMRAEEAEQKASAEKQRAELQTATAQQISDFLAETLQGADPIGLSGYSSGAAHNVDANTTSMELLDRAAAKIQTDLSGQPEVQAKLMQTIGDVYTSFFKFDLAEPLLKQSLELRRQHWGPKHLQVANSLHSLSVFHFLEGDFEGAEALCREALAIRRELLGEQHLDIAASEFALAWNVQFGRVGRSEEAESLMRLALQTRLAQLGPAHRDVGMVRLGLVLVLITTDKPLLALQEVTLAVAALENSQGDNRAAKALSLYVRGFSAHQQKRQAEAAQYFEQALGQIASLFGPAHPVTNYLRCELADAQLEGRDDEAAERVYRESLASNRKLLGRRPFVARSMESLACFLYKRDRYEEAEALLDEAVEIQSETLGSESGAVASLWCIRYEISVRRGDFQQARARLYKEFQIYRGLTPVIYSHAAWDSAWRLSWIAIHDDDLPLFHEACLAMIDSRPIPARPFFAEITAITCTWIPDAIDDPLIAVGLAQEALTTDRNNPWFERALGSALYRAGRIGESIEHLNRSIELDGHGGHVSVLLFLAMAHHRAGDMDKAKAVLVSTREWLTNQIPELRDSEPQQPVHAESRTDGPLTTVAGANEQPAITPLLWQDRAVLKHLFLEADSLIGKSDQ